ncbi:Metalloprotease [Mycena amicta]|nr:Metalloprotease [Mycena amicta]
MMLFTALALLLPAVLTHAVPQRTGGLFVAISTPKANLGSIDSLVLTAAVTNNGPEDVRVLKYGTVLDADLPTRSFTVTRDGTVVPFTGIKLTVSLIDADESAYVTIPAGQTVSATHDVSALYDFASVGAGDFTFTPIPTFQAAPIGKNLTKRSELTLIEFDAKPVTVTVSGTVANRVFPQKRAVDICTTASRKAFIDASYTEAKTLASLASSYITSRGSSDSLYQSYFGATATFRVTSIFNAVSSENNSSRTLSCVDRFNACSAGVIAYEDVVTTNIYFCGIFFYQEDTDQLCGRTTVEARDVRGGITLHELTHAVAKTDDVVYGCDEDQALSDSDAIRNADSFNCFATQVYADTQCTDD